MLNSVIKWINVVDRYASIGTVINLIAVVVIIDVHVWLKSVGYTLLGQQFVSHIAGCIVAT